MADAVEAPTTQPIFVAAAPRSKTVAANTIFREQIASISPFARIEISIPDSHLLGRVEWPDADPDPHEDFVVSSLKN